MPVYQCATPRGMLDATQRDRLAQGITKIHSEETNAPEPFIRVLFLELPEGYAYTAGKIAPTVLITGSIRAGRPEETRSRILHRLHDLAIEVTGVPIDQVVLSAMDFPSHWGMEAGIVMPPPTPEAEAEWFRQLQEAGAVA